MSEPAHGDPAGVIRASLAASEVVWVESGPGRFDVELPGERKLKTACSLAVGEHYLVVNAFVCRRPDENHAVVYRWLLERNTRTYALAFCLDPAGDIYLTGRLPLSVVTAEEVDQLLGSVLELADSSFNTILELGFAESIRAEWKWRLERGEPTYNLAAFEHLRPDS